MLTQTNQMPSHQTAAFVVKTGGKRKTLMDIEDLDIGLGKTVCGVGSFLTPVFSSTNLSFSNMDLGTGGHIRSA